RPFAAHSSGLRNGSATFACGLVQQFSCTRLGSAAHSASVEENSAVSIAVCCAFLAANAGFVCASTRRWEEQSTLLRSRVVHAAVPGSGSPAYWSHTPGAVFGGTGCVAGAAAPG